MLGGETNKVVYLLGSVHVSKSSVERVQKTISEKDIDLVCVELDRKRFEHIRTSGQGGHFPYSARPSDFLSIQGVLRWLQNEIGRELDILPGSEMIAALDAAKQKGVNVALIDRDIDVTIARLWGNLGFSERIKLIGNLGLAVALFAMRPVFGKRADKIIGVFGDLGEKTRDDEIRKVSVDFKALEMGEGIEDLLNLMKKEFPGIYTTLVTERDAHMSKNISQLLKRYDKILVVVGAGHLLGMKKTLETAGINVSRIE